MKFEPGEVRAALNIVADLNEYQVTLVHKPTGHLAHAVGSSDDSEAVFNEAYEELGRLVFKEKYTYIPKEKRAALYEHQL